MKLQTFHIPVLAPEAAQDALNRHLASHRVAHVDRQFVADGAASFWAVCVTSIDGSEGTGVAGADAARKARSVDWREKLSVDEFALYDRLRSARKAQAETEGLPPYAVFSNEQLAAMVQGRVTTAAALAAIEGVGEARMRRYAELFLPLLQAGVPGLPAAAPAASTITAAAVAQGA
jgi:superfamily II DNA helicase RecQ